MKTKQLILADQSREAVKAETSAITIILGHLECKTKGMCLSKLKCGYNCGVKLVTAIETHHWLGIFCIDRLKKWVNYKVYPTDFNHIIKDYIFIKIVETKENNNNNINFDKCNFGTIHFYKVSIADHDDIPFTKGYANVLK